MVTGSHSLDRQSVSVLTFHPRQKASHRVHLYLHASLHILTTGVFHSNREEIEKQKAKERYMKMHLAGKTEQAKADLARLAIIRKQREEAARKKEEERKG